MERLRFDSDVAFTPADERLEAVTFAPLTAPLSGGAPVQAAVVRLGPNGRLKRHPASVPQILAVLEGSGCVSGAEGTFEPITAGEAVFWASGEEHETQTEGGMSALILEGEGVRPFRGRGA